MLAAAALSGMEINGRQARFLDTKVLWIYNEKKAETGLNELPA